MRPLTANLSPAEIAELLEVSPRLVSALLEDGRVLCQLKDGEPRVPLAQLERFFRDALLRLYRVEAGAAAVAAPAAEERQHEPVPHVEAAEEQPAAEAAAAPPAPRLAPVIPADSPELRRMPRYIPRRHIHGIFEDVKFSILQISKTGLRIRHKEALMPGTEGKLTFALLNPARSVVIRTRVVWTSLARSGEDRFAISGLRVIEFAERLEQAVEILRTAHELQPERRARQRRADDVTTVVAGASDDEIALITNAMQKFADDPVEASRWYSRGRFALSDEQVRRIAPQKASDREEVLGIWEYLERAVELEKVAGVVAWTRGAN